MVHNINILFNKGELIVRFILNFYVLTVQIEGNSIFHLIILLMFITLMLFTGTKNGRAFGKDKQLLLSIV